MAGVGRQTDPGREARPEGSPRLRLLVCTSCWLRPWDCACEGKKRTKDKQRVTAPAWASVPVHTAGDVRAAVEQVTGDKDAAYAVAELLGREPEPATRRRRAATRQDARPKTEGGRQLA